VFLLVFEAQINESRIECVSSCTKNQICTPSIILNRSPTQAALPNGVEIDEDYDSLDYDKTLKMCGKLKAEAKPTQNLNVDMFETKLTDCLDDEEYCKLEVAIDARKGGSPVKLFELSCASECEVAFEDLKGKGFKQTICAHSSLEYYDYYYFNPDSAASSWVFVSACNCLLPYLATLIILPFR
jgi:hypothetical protein